MIVAVASGKGGTGKTTVALGLALTAPGAVELLDADVEAPNLALFLHPRLTGGAPVTVPLPVIDRDLCDCCGLCSASCAFNALACMGGPPVVFPELCHGCGGCRLVCPQDAISEITREVGLLEWGDAEPDIRYVQGCMNVGEAKAPPVIEAVKARAGGSSLTIVDCPPGTACPFVAAVRGADVAVLVTEPTPFGLADLGLAIEALEQLRVPFGVVVNRADAGAGDTRAAALCRAHHAPILGAIPNDRRVAEAYARGGLPVLEIPELRPIFDGIHREISRLAKQHSANEVVTDVHV